MKPVGWNCLVIILVALLLFAFVPFAISSSNSGSNSGINSHSERIRVIVEVDPSHKSIARQSLESKGVIRHEFEFFPGYSLEIEKSELEKILYVKKVYPVRRLHIIKPLSAGVSTEDNRNEIINADTLWDLGYTGKNVTIAIIDGGVDETHPDLIGKVKSRVSFVDDEDTGDLYGHGTHCASLAAGTGAVSNGKYRGVAPEANLLNVKVCNSAGYCYEDDILAGIEFAMQHDADVISISLGGAYLTDVHPLDNAVKSIIDRGMVVVIATGNENYYLYMQSLSPGSTLEAITVGASTRNDSMAWFSSRGPTSNGITKPSICAPGVDIIAARASGTQMGTYLDEYYTIASGTSMSTPQVAGAAALLIQAYNNRFGRKATPAEIKAALMLGANRIRDEYGAEYDFLHQGAGRINLSNSYNILMNETTLLAVNPSRWSVSKPTGESHRYTGRSEPMLLYGLKPGDSTEKKFTLIDQDFRVLEINASSEIKDWLELYLDNSSPTHNILNAKITIPEDVVGMNYGNIYIHNETTKLKEIPVEVLVLDNTELVNGTLSIGRNVTINETSYTLFTVPSVTHSQMIIEVGWDSNKTNNSNMMAYLIDPNEFVYYLYYPYTAGCGCYTDYTDNILKMDEPFSGNYTLVIWSPNQTAKVNISLVAIDISAVQDEIILHQNDSYSDTLTIRNLGKPLNNISILGYREKEIPKTRINKYPNVSAFNHTFYIGSEVQRFLISVNMNSTNPECMASVKLYSPSNVLEKYFYGTWCNETELMSINLPDQGEWRLEFNFYEDDNLEDCYEECEDEADVCYEECTDLDCYYSCLDELEECYETCREESQSGNVSVSIENSLYRHERYQGIQLYPSSIDEIGNDLDINYTIDYDPSLAGRDIKAYVGLFSNEVRISIPLSVVQPLNLTSVVSIKPFRGGWLTGSMEIPEGDWFLIFRTNLSTPAKLQFIAQGGIYSSFSDGGYIEIPLECDPYDSYDYGSYECTGELDDKSLLIECSEGWGETTCYLSIDMDANGRFSGIGEKSFMEGEILNVSGNLYEVISIGENKTRLFKFSRSQEFDLTVSGSCEVWDIKIMSDIINPKIELSDIPLDNESTGSSAVIDIDKERLVRFYLIVHNPTDRVTRGYVYAGDYYHYYSLSGGETERTEIPLEYLNSKTKIEVSHYLSSHYPYSFPELYYEAIYSDDNTTAGISYSFIPFCSSCAECQEKVSTSKGEIMLVSDISSDGTCIEFDSKGVIFDCQGHEIEGNGTGSGILMNENSNNIKNCIIKKFENGIYLNSSDNIISNNTIRENSNGIVVVSQNNTISGNFICLNGVDVASYGYENSGHGNACDNITGWNDEWEEGCTYSCALSLCSIRGDQYPCDGIVSLSELLDYIVLWNDGDVHVSDLIDAIKNWRENNGVTTTTSSITSTTVPG